MAEKQKILITDDDRISRVVLQGLLKDQYEIIMAASGREAINHLKQDPHIDLIILDIVMPDISGFDTIRLIREREETKEIPVIFITAKDSEEDEMEGLHLGASDYITKPFLPAIVKLRVENHLRFARQKKMLEEMAGRDSLTEIANRRSFDALINREWGRAIRQGTPMSLAMVDVDNFKAFNDSYGHAQGDHALVSVARGFEAMMRRSTDTAARYGGEEFLLLFADTTREAGIERAEKIRAAVEDLAIPHEKSEPLPVLTISIGGASLGKEDKNPRELIKAADTMLYKAKNNGKNQICWR